MLAGIVSFTIKLVPVSKPVLDIAMVQRITSPASNGAPFKSCTVLVTFWEMIGTYSSVANVMTLG